LCLYPALEGGLIASWCLLFSALGRGLIASWCPFSLL